MLRVDDVSVTYDVAAALDDATLEVAAGETVTVLGPQRLGKDDAPARRRRAAAAGSGTSPRRRPRHRDRAAAPARHRPRVPGARPVPAPRRRGQCRLRLRMRGDYAGRGREAHDRAPRARRPRGLRAARPSERSPAASSSGSRLHARSRQEPRLLLLDEPLGSLDRRLRDRLLDDLAHLFEELDLTALYVTHDQTEAFTLGDRVAVMRDGRVVQVARRTSSGPTGRRGRRALPRHRERRGDELVRPEAVAVRRAADGRGDGDVEPPCERASGARRVRLDDGRGSRRPRGARPPARGRASRRRDRSGGHRSPPMIRRRVVVHGHVQGVFFRDTVRRHAVNAGVFGWVRNTSEGAVEAVFEGTIDAVGRLVSISRKGPRGARVDRVEVFEEEPEGLGGFSIR